MYFKFYDRGWTHQYNPNRHSTSGSIYIRLAVLRICDNPCELWFLRSTRVLTQQTKVFMFAGGADQLLPLEKARIGFEPLVNAGYAVEWHVEPDLSHGADCMNGNGAWT